MPDSQPKIVAILTVRLASQRLPGKVLLEIEGQTVLQHIVNRLKNTTMITKVVAAVSEQWDSKPLIEAARDMGLACFVGSDEDVLGRVYGAAIEHDADIVVRVCGDCPLLDVNATDRLIQHLIDVGCEYSHNRHAKGVPFGMHAEVLTMACLERLNELAKARSDREHVTLFILDHKETFHINNVAESPDIQRPDYQLSLDTKEDFELITLLYQRLGRRIENTKAIIQFLDEHPDISQMNRYVHNKEHMELIHGEL